MPSLPRTMHAVLLTGHGGPERLVYREDVPVPAPGPGEVLLRVAAAGVNNTDVNTRIGWYAAEVTGSTADASAADADVDAGGWAGALAFPRIQGADACGRIVAVGDGVPAARIGERAIVQACLVSRARGGQAPWLGSEVDGAFAQYVVAPAADTWAVDAPGLTDAQLGAVPCAYGTAANLLHRAGLLAGERVLVTGASGGVGAATVQLAQAAGAEVVAVASAAKADAVRALGAQRVVDRDAPLREALDGPVDVAVDVVGGPGFAAVLEALRPGGRYATSGAIAGPVVPLDLRTLYLRDLTLVGCTLQSAEAFGGLVRLLEEGRLVPLVAATFPLAEIREAQAVFDAKRHVGKLVLLPPA